MTTGRRRRVPPTGPVPARPARAGLAVAALGALLALAPHAARGQAQVSTPNEDEVTDLFARVALVRAELELIRIETGKPQNRQADLGVSDAATREVFSQALTLFLKADRLAFELTRERAPLPATPREIGSTQVDEVVDAALDRVQRVKAELGIAEAGNPAPTRADSTPTDVFRSIVQANRQLNLLLDRQFSPSDVFRQVTTAIGYASVLLDRFPGATRIPPQPPFERGKRPAHVYRRLISCYERVRALAERSGVRLLTLETSDELIGVAVPSDVYDIASLLVSELAHLHGLLPGAAPPRAAYDPGRKFPSHVYQRAGILEAQLLELDGQVEREPNWLGLLDEVGAR